VQFTN